MSYDGGLSIKIVNSELLTILKNHVKQGTFDGAKEILGWIGKRCKNMSAAIKYEDWDCAIIHKCPKNLTDVLYCAMCLFEFFDDEFSDYDVYSHLMKELRENKEKIDSSYTYVRWEYEHEDGHDVDGTEIFTFENGVESYEVE